MITEHLEKEATITLSIDNRRTEITEGDFKVAVIPIPTNKQYNIKLLATDSIRLVLVVKRDERPTLWDFYGGDRISSSATLLEIDLSTTRLRKMEPINTATGIGTVKEDNGTMTVTITGTVRSKNDTTNLYIGLMPPLHDDLLCERCRARSEGPCGFCFATTKTSSTIDVNITIGRYVKDCLFWDHIIQEWTNAGCKVSVTYLSANVLNNKLSYTSCRYCYGLICIVAVLSYI